MKGLIDAVGYGNREGGQDGVRIHGMEIRAAVGTRETRHSCFGVSCVSMADRAERVI